MSSQLMPYIVHIVEVTKESIVFRSIIIYFFIILKRIHNNLQPPALLLPLKIKNQKKRKKKTLNSFSENGKKY